MKSQASEAAKQAKSKTEETIGQAKSKAGEMADTTKGRVTDLQQRGQVVLEEQKERLATALDAGKKAAQRKKVEVSEDAEPSADEASTEA